jgi:putative salt-induced outer membrane protein YdiY
MKNGDRYTCEIVGLSQGQLKVKTVNTTGSVLLDWEKVDRIQSTQFFAVELSDGSYLAGIIEKVPVTQALNDFNVTAGGQTISVSGAAVVSIVRSGRKLKGRLSGAISAGFNYTKGNSTKQYNLTASVTARSRTQEFTPAVSSTFSGQSNASTTRRNDVSFQYWKALSRNWLVGSYEDFLRSDEQQLDLRATFGGFGARRLVRTNRTYLTLAAGAVFTTEHYRATDDVPERQKNTEGLIAVRFSMFRFDSTNITAESFIYPSITTPGRYRIDSNVNGKIDLTHSVNVTLSFYSNFDSHPPVNVPRTDAGVNLGLGWSF